MTEEVNQVEATEAATNVENQDEIETKTFNQEQLDKIVEERLLKQRRAFEKKYAGFEPERFKELVEAEESRQQEEAKKRGEFEQVLKTTVSKHKDEVTKLRNELQHIKVDGAVINSASLHKAINPEQVSQLLKNQVRLGEDGGVEVIDPQTGSVRYNDNGEGLGIDELVSGFLQSNPHFVAATPAGYE